MPTKKKSIRLKLRPAKAMRTAVRAQQQQQEVTALGRAMRALGSAGGTALGAYLGQPMAGGAIGSSLAGAVSRWLGQGDYTVGSNSIVSASLKAASSIPSMHSDGQTIVVRHKEYLGEVRSSTTFNVQQSFVLNPGNPSTFPWLSDIAAKFQEYRIRGAVFHYVPSSGSVASGTNPGLGTVMLQTTYRSTDTIPANKVEMLNEYCANEVVPSEPMAHPIECDPKENPFNIQYVRTGAVPATDTQLIYDLGVTHLAVSGQQASGNVIGDLWITYEVELKKPVVSSNVTSTAKYWNVATASPTTSVVFNSSSQTFGNLGITITGNNTFKFPKGSVGSWVIYETVAPSTAFSSFNMGGAMTLTNCTIEPGYTLMFSAGAGPDTAYIFKLLTIRISDPAVEATVNTGTHVWSGTAATSFCSVSQYSD